MVVRRRLVVIGVDDVMLKAAAAVAAGSVAEITLRDGVRHCCITIQIQIILDDYTFVTTGESNISLWRNHMRETAKVCKHFLAYRNFT